MSHVGVPAELPEPLTIAVVERLRATEPDAVAILVTGSYATRTATETSDLDVTAIVARVVRTPYRMWFAERAPTPPLHVSAAAKPVAAWREARGVPARWSLGFPARTEARYLWSTPDARAELGDDPSLEQPPAPPELEDFVDFVLKAKRSARADDESGMRWFAREAALLAPGLLAPLNPRRVVSDRRDALDAALAFSVAPAMYVADLRASLGLTSATGTAVCDAVARLGHELLGFLRQRAPDIDPMPDIARALRDGSLQRYLDAI